MKLILMMMLLFTNTVYAQTDLEKFSANNCSHSRQANWKILGLMHKDHYEISWSSNGPFKKYGRAVLKLSTLTYSGKGSVNDLIFVKLKDKVAVTNKHGVNKKVDLLEESAECKMMWLVHEFHENKYSYPRLPEAIMTRLSNDNDVKQAKLARIRITKLEKEKIIELKKIDKKLLKVMSKKGLAKFKANNCIKFDHYKQAGDGRARVYYKLYLVATKKRNYAGFWKDDPLFDGLVSQDNIAKYYQKSKKSVDGIPLYTKSNKCRRIITSNPNKKMAKRRKLKKKKESLYD